MDIRLLGQFAIIRLKDTTASANALSVALPSGNNIIHSICWSTDSSAATTVVINDGVSEIYRATTGPNGGGPLAADDAIVGLCICTGPGSAPTVTVSGTVLTAGTLNVTYFVAGV